ncbi:DUF4328 domain-containing protein [Kribbella albertanoniae]|uniref:DUF4328 domain-containing protein n=2 Tax=Kribbella albertanoniae TaxID=1266829 RepID=A0A4R4Q3D3_9ACTN|nr:DUF4328 domain-containing protein [Kribbella albertanoniae]
MTMTQPYYPVPRPGPYAVLPPRYRPLRTFALVAIVLMGLTALITVLQSVLMWRSYDEVKNFIFLNLTEEEFENATNAIVGSGWLINVLAYLLFGTAIAYLLWLWYARENSDFLNSALAPRPPANPLPPGQGLHRRSAGWAIGAWFCPGVQFWYPLQLVQDIVIASEPLEQPGAARSQQIRALLYSWWVAWVGYWVIIVAGLLAATIGFFAFFVQVVESADNASRTTQFYEFQDVMVRVALWVDIGFSVAALLLIVATASMSLLMLQVNQWQQQRATAPPIAPVQDYRPPSFPSYRPLS